MNIKDELVYVLTNYITHRNYACMEGDRLLNTISNIRNAFDELHIAVHTTTIGELLFPQHPDKKVNYICGACGALEYLDTVYETEGGDCFVCGEDEFIELRDFDERELDEYIKEACTKLGLDREQLKQRFNHL